MRKPLWHESRLEYLRQVYAQGGNYDKALGWIQGRDDGLVEGGATLMVRLLDRHVGPLSARQKKRIDDLHFEALIALSRDALDLEGAEDLDRWLAGNYPDEADEDGVGGGFSRTELARFNAEIAQTEARVTFRWKEAPLTAVKRAAALAGVPFQSYIKQILYERATADLANSTIVDARAPKG